jgi:hypothetical protein
MAPHPPNFRNKATKPAAAGAAKERPSRDGAEEVLERIAGA